MRSKTKTLVNTITEEAPGMKLVNATTKKPVNHNIKHATITMQATTKDPATTKTEIAYRMFPIVKAFLLKAIGKRIIVISKNNVDINNTNNINNVSKTR